MGLITLKELHKGLGGKGKEVQVLKGIDLTVDKGQTISVMGASGVGKSTLLNIMGALDRPTSVDVLYRDSPLSGLDDRRLASMRNRFVGFVFQSHHLLPEFSALENVMLPALIGGVNRIEAQKRAEALLEEVGLGSRLGHKPGELSGGEQQRAAIVRALVQTPEAILADEPTGNLDTKTAEEVFEVLLTLNRSRGTAIVMVTHNERLSSRLERRLQMVDGKIFED